MKFSLDICSNLKEEWRFRNLSNDASIHFFFFFWVRSLSKTITISEEFQVLYAHYEKRGTFAASSYATSLSNWEKNDVVVLLLKLMMLEHEPPDLPHHGFGTSLPMLVWGQKEACFWICQISSKNEVIFHLYVRRSKYLMLILCETLRRISWYS